MIVRVLKRIVYYLACLFALAFFIFVGEEDTLFPKGETYTFYCGSASSEAQIVTCIKGERLAKLLLSDVRGESTEYPFSALSNDEENFGDLTFGNLTFVDSAFGDSAAMEKREGCVEKFLSFYGAKLLFSEETCGVTNYYCYAPSLGRTIALYGAAVNLHIAVKKESVCVGTPILFGGY